MSNVNHWLFEPSKKPKEEHYLRKTERECFRSVCDLCLKEHGRVSTKQIAEDLQKSGGTASKCLNTLMEKGLVSYSRKDGGWGLSDQGIRTDTWKAACSSHERKNRQR